MEKEQGEVSGIRYLMFHAGVWCRFTACPLRICVTNIFYIKEWKMHPKSNKNYNKSVTIV